MKNNLCCSVCPLIGYDSTLSAQGFIYFADQTAGQGGTKVQIEIVGPTAIIGDNYRLNFTTLGGNLVYAVENLTSQSVVFDGVAADELSPIFDGLQATIIFPPAQIEDIVEVKFGAAVVDPPVPVFRPGDRESDGGPNSTGEYTFVGADIARNETNMMFYDYELRFDGNPDGRNKIFYRFGGQGVFDAPFVSIRRTTPFLSNFLFLF